MQRELAWKLNSDPDAGTEDEGTKETTQRTEIRGGAGNDTDMACRKNEFKEIHRWVRKSESKDGKKCEAAIYPPLVQSPAG